MCSSDLLAGNRGGDLGVILDLRQLNAGRTLSLIDLSPGRAQVVRDRAANIRDFNDLVVERVHQVDSQLRSTAALVAFQYQGFPPPLRAAYRLLEIMRDSNARPVKIEFTPYAGIDARRLPLGRRRANFGKHGLRR